MAKRKPTVLSETDRAYLAGIIDGEGSIMMIHHKPRPNGNGTKWEYWVLRVSVANTDIRLIIWLLEKFGGGFSTGKNKRPNQKDHYQWRLDSKRAEPILRAALPYLILKREQAELALKMISTYKLVGCKGHPPETIEYRRELATRIKELNRRGKIEEAA